MDDDSIAMTDEYDDVILDDEAMADEVMGDEVMGDEVMGDEVMGDEVMGDEVMGDEVMGDEVMGDEVIVGSNNMGSSQGSSNMVDDDNVIDSEEMDMVQSSVRPGCTYANANNYDPLATIDDGSCVYTGAHHHHAHGPHGPINPKINRTIILLLETKIEMLLDMQVKDPTLLNVNIAIYNKFICDVNTLHYYSTTHQSLILEFIMCILS